MRRITGWRTLGIRDKPTQDRRRDPCGKPQRTFLVRRQRRHQRGEAFPTESLPVVEQCLSVPGDADEGGAPIIGVSEPGDQAEPLESLDQLSHGRLANPFLGGQRRQPTGPFTAHPVHHERSRGAQIGAVREKPRGQVQCLIEKLADVIEGVFLTRPISHLVSISRGLCSGNRSRVIPRYSPFTENLAQLPLLRGMRAWCEPARSQGRDPPNVFARSTTVTRTTDCHPA
jgi:hypothetical protein